MVALLLCNDFDMIAGYAGDKGTKITCNLPQNTCLWVFRPDFDLVFTEAQLQALPPAAQRQVRHYSYYDPDMARYILCSDDARFVNHADDPNMGDDGEINYAVRDIQVGEELTWNYRPWIVADFLE